METLAWILGVVLVIVIGILACKISRQADDLDDRDMTIKYWQTRYNEACKISRQADDLDDRDMTIKYWQTRYNEGVTSKLKVDEVCKALMVKEAANHIQLRRRDEQIMRLQGTRAAFLSQLCDVLALLNDGQRVSITTAPAEPGCGEES